MRKGVGRRIGRRLIIRVWVILSTVGSGMSVKPVIGGSEGHSLWFILIFPILKV